LPWWEYTLSKWYLDLQNATNVPYASDEAIKLNEYRLLLQNGFDKLDSPPGDIAVRSKEWKLILRKNRELLEKVSWWRFITDTLQPVEALELYDLINDPGEKLNVAKKYPDVVNRLKGKLQEWDASVENRKVKYQKIDKRMIIPYP
jgi:hypothetical protein